MTDALPGGILRIFVYESQPAAVRHLSAESQPGHLSGMKDMSWAHFGQNIGLLGRSRRHTGHDVALRGAVAPHPLQYRAVGSGLDFTRLFFTSDPITTSRPQCLQTAASALIASAQFGHFLNFCGLLNDENSSSPAPKTGRNPKTINVIGPKSSPSAAHILHDLLREIASIYAATPHASQNITDHISKTRI
jgi:hypothetical protein